MQLWIFSSFLLLLEPVAASLQEHPSLEPGVKPAALPPFSKKDRTVGTWRCHTTGTVKISSMYDACGISAVFSIFRIVKNCFCNTTGKRGLRAQEKRHRETHPILEISLAAGAGCQRPSWYSRGALCRAMHRDKFLTSRGLPLEQASRRSR